MPGSLYLQNPSAPTSNTVPSSSGPSASGPSSRVAEPSVGPDADGSVSDAEVSPVAVIEVSEMLPPLSPSPRADSAAQAASSNTKPQWYVFTASVLRASDTLAPSPWTPYRVVDSTAKRISIAAVNASPTPRCERDY